ncbi:lysoplasmalogenase [Kordiimonas gwangyangensis]|uniref:lysoplasmalogenase n=2 Tax=Kordiimonas gwangyangensis TaxID=288022 RepID=UPI00035D8887|nr:lysoplasmalogenase [Kordiimonas gwangyangensis]
MTRIFSERKRPIVEAIGQIFVILSMIGAIAYGVGLYPEGILWQALVKMSAVSFLVLFVGINLRSFTHFLLLLALVASVTGDVMLVLPQDGAFLYGLMAFGVAHIIFILMYLINGQRFDRISASRLRYVLLLWAFAFVAGFWMYDALGEMRNYVLGYTAMLVLMASTAILSRFPPRLVGIGAVLFVFSDAALGARQFMSVPEFVGYFVWASYYLSQFMVTLGVMLTDDRPAYSGGYRFD